MKNFRQVLAGLLVGLSLATTSAQAALTANQQYQLNTLFGPVAYAMKLGDRILDAGVGATLASGKIFLGASTNLAAAVTPSGDVTISNAGVTAIGAGKVTEAMLAAMSGTVAGLGVKRTAHLIWDPSAVVAHRTGTAATLGAGYTAVIPAGAIITSVYFYTKTLAVSDNNARTIALNCIGAGDLLIAIDPDATTGLFAADALTAGEVTGTKTAHSTFVGLKATAGCEPTYTVSAGSFSAGRTHIYIDYVIAN